MSVWPSTLPGFPLTDWGYRPKSSILKSDMEVGIPKRRRRSTNEITKVSGTLELSAAQEAIFRDFVDNTLSGGVAPFTWHDFVEDRDRTCFLGIDSGGDRYSLTQKNATTFLVKVSLELLP